MCSAVADGEPDERLGVLVLSVWGDAVRRAGDPTPIRIRALARPPLSGDDPMFYVAQPDEIIAYVQRWLAVMTGEGSE